MLNGVDTKSVQLCMCVYLEKEKKIDMKKVSEGEDTQAPLLYREGSLRGDAQVAGRSGKMSFFVSEEESNTTQPPNAVGHRGRQREEKATCWDLYNLSKLLYITQPLRLIR